MSEMCENPGNKCTSIPLVDNWVNDAVNDVC